jgi:hypothetical protein
MMHRHNGVITAITGMGHSTYKGVAHWFFIGDIKWADGTESKAREISPTMLCHDDTDADKQAVNTWLELLNEYLEENGMWHEPKLKRDGRQYSWTPNKKENRQPVVTVKAMSAAQFISTVMS